MAIVDGNITPALKRLHAEQSMWFWSLIEYYAGAGWHIGQMDTWL
jgi:hypothetical protein